MLIHTFAGQFRKHVIIVCALALPWLGAPGHAAPANAARSASGPIIAVMSIDDGAHAAAVRDGIQEGLRRAGYAAGKNVRLQTFEAGGDPARIRPLAERIVSERPQVIVALGQQVALAVKATTREVPVVYSAVADPVGAGLIAPPVVAGQADANAENRAQGASGAAGNVTGVSDALTLERQVELIRALAPQARRVGIVYDPQDAGAAAAVKQLQATLPKAGMTLVEAIASRAVDVGPATRSLIEKVDVFYSHRARDGFGALVRVANDFRIPLVAAQTSAVPLGAAAALGISDREVGVQTGVMVARLLKGETPGQVKPQAASRLVLHINTGTAQQQGAVISESLLKSAGQVVKVDGKP